MQGEWLVLSILQAKNKGNKGITLIEVLIALVIVSISLMALWKSLGSTINNYEYLHKKIRANIVAKNMLIENSLQQNDIQNTYAYNIESSCLYDKDFICAINTKYSPNQHLKIINIIVKSAKDGQILVQINSLIHAK
jgi:type II secretion system protein I